MTIRVATESGTIIEVDANSATIGRGTGCAVSLPDAEQLQPQHAIIKKVAGRWMVESTGDHLLAVTGAEPARLHWLKPGDVVRLSESGPEITFEPASTPAAVAVSHSAPIDATTPAVPSPTDVSASATVSTDARPTACSPMVIWGSIGAVALLLAGVYFSGIFSPDRSDVTVVEHGGTDTGQGNDQSSQKPDDPPQQPPEELEPHLQPERAIYALIVKATGGQRYQLGTAFAVSPQRLVTTAGLIEAGQKLAKSEADLSVGLLSPIDGKVTELDLSRAKVHPEFTATTNELDQIIPKIEKLEKELAEAESQEEADKTIDQLVELQEQVYQVSERRFYHDIGVIEVEPTMSDVLEVASPDSMPQVGIPFTLWGIPVVQAEEILDPTSPPQPEKSAGKVLALLPSANAQDYKRLNLRCDLDLSGFDWPGGPVLNGEGKVIAVYARVTPPPMDEKQAPRMTTHDAISLRLLGDLR